jgi:hypothetical protein
MRGPSTERAHSLDQMNQPACNIVTRYPQTPGPVIRVFLVTFWPDRILGSDTLLASDSGDSLRQLILKAFLLCAVYLGNIGISVNDEQKIAALHGIHDTLEHLTLQHAFQHQASRTRAKGGP